MGNANQEVVKGNNYLRYAMEKCEKTSPSRSTSRLARLGAYALRYAQTLSLARPPTRLGGSACSEWLGAELQTDWHCTRVH
jgi:hypothetical protein